MTTESTYIDKHLRKAMGSLGKEAIIERPPDMPGFFTLVGTASDPDSDIFPFMRNAVKEYYPEVDFVPFIMPAATDMRFLREEGTQAYGFALFPPGSPMDTMATLPHGPNERVRLKTIECTFKAYYNLAREFLA